MKQPLIGHRRWLFPVALSAILAGSGLWYGINDYPPLPTAEAPLSSAQQTGPARPSPGTLPAAAPVEAGVPPAPNTTPRSLGPEPFAPSLAGTDIDGALQADANGQLVINLRVRDFFDYFLSTVGEVSPETAIRQIEQMARTHLPEPASGQALALLDQYLAYKQASLAVMQTRLDPRRQGDAGYQLAALGDAMAQLKRLRQSTFDAEVHQAFFGLEEAYSEYTLATLAIQQRDDLSQQGKQALVEWHRNQLPEALKTTEERLYATTRQQQARIAAITNASSADAAGQQLTDLGLDPEGVEGVVSYLEHRERFDQRFQSFQEALNRKGANGLAAQDLEARREELLLQHFPNEQDRTWARLKMLDSS
ncbi:lipase secretion chaperone [Marinobacter sp. Arc7-DN-1]|uniref:lipase secretion chaperone n=1 Tax=Marinobacter sp. Arc7-DN-1 TaxID=2304594 RepID=UPI000E43ED03|nr:lipase secretion chaperone [Marinobacter sp. Arc7-DN-1]AXS83411.1 lipase chaperone [Marinobacter sp. Arc7-DN-1]